MSGTKRPKPPLTRRGSGDDRPSGERRLAVVEDAPAVPPSAEDRYGPGSVIADEYRLVRTLGEGGMGAVWVAHDEAVAGRRF